MEIQPSHHSVQTYSHPGLLPINSDARPEEPAPQLYVSREYRMTRSSHKSSQLGNEDKPVVQAQRHKPISKKHQKSNRTKLTLQKKKRLQKLKQADRKSKKEQGLTNISPAPIMAAVTYSPLNLLGYTYFSTEIHNAYLSKPTETHFEQINKMVETHPISLGAILNEVSEHHQKSTPNIQKYLSLIDITKRIEDQGKVVFKKMDGIDQNKSLLVSYKLKELPGMEKRSGLDQQEQASKVKNENHNQIQDSIQIKNQLVEQDTKQEEMDLEIADMVEMLDEDIRTMEFRRQFMGRLGNKMAQYSQEFGKKVQEISEISKELLFLTACLTQTNKCNQYNISKLKTQMTLSLEDNPPESVEPYEDRLIQLVFQKNISMALKMEDIDIMNYYKFRACEEENREFIAITEQRKYVEYIKKKRPTKAKKPKAPIHSACTACLSSYNQQTNPFTHCHDCGSKIHTNCKLFLVDENGCCKLCLAKRVRSKRKDFFECALCPNKGLTFMKVGNQNVHAFCILITGRYHIQGHALKVSKSALELNISSSPCHFCSKTSHKLYKFEDSNSHCHATCAYLNGCYMDFKSNKLHIYLTALSQQDKIKLEFTRKYKLNYDGIVFKCFSLEEYMRQTAPDALLKQNKSSNSSDSIPLSSQYNNEEEQEQLEKDMESQELALDREMVEQEEEEILVAEQSEDK